MTRKGKRKKGDAVEEEIAEQINKNDVYTMVKNGIDSILFLHSRKRRGAQ